MALHGIHSNVRNEHLPVRKLISAAYLHYPAKDNTKRAFTISEFTTIIKGTPPTCQNNILMRSLWTIAFATGLRGAELLPPKQKNLSAQQSRFLLRRDRIFLWNPPKSSFRTHLAIIWYFKSKTNGTLKQQFANIPCTCTKLQFCAIYELERLLITIKDCKPNTAIFSWTDGNYITTGAMRRRLLAAADAAGLDIAKLGNHSTRKLCITYSIQCGLPDTVVAQIGRWKCFDSIRPYINLNPLDLDMVRARAMHSPHQKGAIIDDHRYITSQAKKFSK